MADYRSMAAARGQSKGPSASRDGFHLIPDHLIEYDVDLSHKYQDIQYRKSNADSCAILMFDRPKILHAFRPRTIREMIDAFQDAMEDSNIRVILISSTTSSAFCAGGDQTVRGDGGYEDETEKEPQLRVLQLQRLMRSCPKPIIAVVQGYAIGGGHILHMCADLTLASSNAVFGQTGPRMGSFDAGFGCTEALAHMGMKRAKELWMLCKFYTADEALRMGLINAVVSPDQLQHSVAQWVRRIGSNSPTAIACCKAALNATQDGATGLQVMGNELTRLFYLSAEGKEGKQAFIEKRAPRWMSSKL